MSAQTVFLDRRAFDRGLRDLELTLSRLKADAVPRVNARALNRAIDRARTGTVRALAQAKGVPSKFLRKRVQAYKATPKTLRGSLWVGLQKPIPIDSIPGARLVTQGKHAGTLRAGRLSVKPFKATMPNGKTGLWLRVEPGKRWTRFRPPTSSPNLPIERPSVRLQPEAGVILEAQTQAVMRDFLIGEYRRLLGVEIDKLKARI